jgi:hypothetical protein
MHMSKLSTFVIDCQTDDLDAAASFWSRALRRGLRPPQEGDARYRDLVCGPSEPLLMIQRVEHEGRVHLDIESDDIDAEVARLEALGARRVERVRSWVVMQAPTGQRFCVVRPQRASGSAPPLTGSAQHERLRRLAGDYTGVTRTWLDPAAAPDESTATLHVESIFGGRWLRFEHRGSVMGKPHEGEALLGFHIDEGRFEHCWVDSFHTGSAMMWSKGEAHEDGVIRVTGSYAAGPERWGWRTEFHLGEALEVRAFNISPAGEESRAIETRWTRVEPG